MAFLTTIPISITAPIAEITLKVVLVRNRAMAPPEKAKGIENIIMKGI
jgi:hypothetical protein